MNKQEFNKLSWPRGLNLNLIAQVLDEVEFLKFIRDNRFLSRNERRIVLPSASCFRKVYCHYLWSQVKSGKRTWGQTRKNLQREFGGLKNIKLDKDRVKAFYEQREKEIRLERNT